jgi:hypothetical protein
MRYTPVLGTYIRRNKKEFEQQDGNVDTFHLKLSLLFSRVCTASLTVEVLLAQLTESAFNGSLDDKTCSLETYSQGNEPAAAQN